MDSMTSRKKLAILYVITMTAAFVTRYGDFILSYQLQILIGMFWIIISIFKLLVNGFHFTGALKKDYKNFLVLYLMPHFLIHLYTLFLMIIGKVSWSYFTTDLTVYVPTLVAVFSVYLFGTRAFFYNCISVVFAWVLSITSSIMLKGVGIVPYAIIQAYGIETLGNFRYDANYFELHDIVLAVGYIVVFYIFTSMKKTIKNILIIFFVLFILSLGMKRISMLGFVFSVIFYWISKNFKDKNKYRFCMCAGFFAFFVCYIYVYIMSLENVFTNFVTKFGINTMGRVYYYKEIMKYAEFSPFFMGIGRNVCTRVLTTDLSYLNVAGVHSDILKMYVENGFIVFGLWICYYLFYITRFYKNFYGYKEALLYFGLTIYTFTLYLTDNIEVYFICQIMQIVIPVCYALKNKEIKRS